MTTIFGIKLNFKIIAFIVIIYLILMGHIFMGCTNIPIAWEGLTTIGKAVKKEAMTTIGINNKKTDVNNTTKLTNPHKKEGFQSAGNNSNEILIDAAPFVINNYTSVDTSKWTQPNLVVVPGQSINEGPQSILKRNESKLPLPNDELLLFANTQFKPECCPNTYSNGSGCACMNTNSYNYLITRGQNNTPYSEY